MPNLDQFFDRTMTREYNCLDHTREVWLELRGEDLLTRLPKLRGPFSGRTISIVGARTFQLLKTPQTPCIALMQKRHERPHIGVFYKGSIMHLGQQGVECQPIEIATRGFETVRYYQ